MVDRRTRGEAAVLIVALFAASLMEAAIVGLIFPLITLAGSPDTVLSQPYVGPVFSTLGVTNPHTVYAVLGVAFFLVFMLKNAFVAGTIYWRTRFAIGNEALMANRILRRYLDSGYAMHLRRNSAELINNMQVSVKQTFTYVLLEALNIASEALVVVSIAAVLITIEPVIALTTMAAMTCAMAGVHLSMRRSFITTGERSITLQQQALQMLQQCLGSIKEVKLSGREKFFGDAYSKLRHDFARVSVTSNVLNLMPRLILETLMVAVILLVILTVSIQGRSGSEIVAVLGLFGAATFRLMPSMNRIVMSLNQMKYGLPAVERVYRDCNQPIEPDFQPPAGRQTPRPSSAAGTVKCEDVSFVYETASNAALERVSLTIRPGESIGLVGGSGAGKTTLADMLLGLFPPTSGTLSVDGADAWSDIRAWRNRCGYVPQSIYLLDDTIRRNIAFGRGDAEIDDDIVWKVAHLAQIDDFIKGLPRGLDTHVGEFGSRLSGGQRQRIGIARALYGDPSFLVLDEATSALDSATEQSISLAIERFQGFKTIVIVAHRLSTVRKCDRLFLLNSGRVRAWGSFDELVRTSLEFKEMVRLATLHDGTLDAPAPAAVGE